MTGINKSLLRNFIK